MIKKQCFLVDLDGTIAFGNGRDFYNPKQEEILADIPIKPTIYVVNSLYNSRHFDIVFLSGREDKYHESSVKWIEKNTQVGSPKLYMRKTGDQRKDCIIKWEIIERDILPFYDIIAAIDDRKQVIDMLLEKGIFVFDVGQGKGDF